MFHQNPTRIIKNARFGSLFISDLMNIITEDLYTKHILTLCTVYSTSSVQNGLVFDFCSGKHYIIIKASFYLKNYNEIGLVTITITTKWELYEKMLNFFWGYSLVKNSWQRRAS